MKQPEVIGVLFGIVGCIILYVVATTSIIAPNGMSVNFIATIIGAVFVWLSGLLLGFENFH